MCVCCLGLSRRIGRNLTGGTSAMENPSAGDNIKGMPSRCRRHMLLPDCSRLHFMLVFTIALLALPPTCSGAISTLTRHYPRRAGSFYPTNPLSNRKRITEADEGMVAADDERCSQIGRDALLAGGNAVDAAVATAFCLGVVNPVASGIGGGSFLLLRLSNGTAVAYDMRETAPAAAHQDMYAEDPQLKVKGGLSAGVPGELAGLHLVWSHHGRLPWPALVAPAIALADGGFVVQPYLAYYINHLADDILADQGLRETFTPGGKPLVAGDICYRKNLANTLKEVAKQGPKAFYSGPIAENFIRDVQAAGGILTLEDLRDYKVAVREPVVADTMGFTVISMPPPSSGGPSLVLILNILAKYGYAAAYNGLQGLHRLIEAFKHTYAVRMNLADPDFVDVKAVVADMLDPDFAASLHKQIVDNSTFPPEYYGGRWRQLEDHGTSHFSIVDAHRNAVAMTTTVNYPFGALVLSPSTGVLLNNEMDDFAIPTSQPPGYLPPPPQNFIRPGKRPLSSMTPTIVLQGGRLYGVLGGSGGIRIITTVAQVFLNQFVKKLDALTSVASTRVHHQLAPNIVHYENWTLVTGKHLELDEETRKGLESKGHVLEADQTGAVCQLVVQDLDNPAVRSSFQSWLPYKRLPRPGVFYGKLIGVSDERKDGAPAGF
ncbi:hypothetical protein M758_12G058000 [Ceratodon purpureus]|nr:hypothetical protein M758_12G058000 [Ceratodon purpureus]